MQALKKLYRANASNLFPYPFYSAFHYSHPSLWECERALERRIGVISLQGFGGA